MPTVCGGGGGRTVGGRQIPVQIGECVGGGEAAGAFSLVTHRQWRNVLEKGSYILLHLTFLICATIVLERSFVCPFTAADPYTQPGDGGPRGVTRYQYGTLQPSTTAHLGHKTPKQASVLPPALPNVRWQCAATNVLSSAYTETAVNTCRRDCASRSSSPNKPPRTEAPVGGGRWMHAPQPARLRPSRASRGWR